MIIQRKHEWLGILYEQDALARAAIDEAFTSEKVGNNEKEKLLNYNHFNIPAFLNIGCGIPGKCYARFMEAFDKLDKTAPYDNGLTFNNVTSIEYETSRKGTAIQCRFVEERPSFDIPYRIVGFATIENRGLKLEIINNWEMTQPFVIG